MTEERKLDLICIGRTCVDLYGEQEGSRLEDVQSFRKYVGGSSTNIAVGATRRAMQAAKDAGTKIVLDIDYRPNFWGKALLEKDVETTAAIKAGEAHQTVIGYLPGGDLLPSSKAARGLRFPAGVHRGRVARRDRERSRRGHGIGTQGSPRSLCNAGLRPVLSERHGRARAGKEGEVGSGLRMAAGVSA